MDQVEYDSFLDFVKGVQDPRKARGKRYGWQVVLSLLCMGLAIGQKTAWAIARWAKHQQDVLCRMLGTTHIPSHSTLYRALRYIDIDDLEAQISAYGQGVDEQEDEQDHSEETVAGGLRGQSVDGKEIRGASAHGETHHLLGLARHGKGTIVG